MRPMNDLNLLTTFAAAVAGSSIPLFGTRPKKYRPSSHQCVSCQTPIPPGKQGRKCEGCRRV